MDAATPPTLIQSLQRGMKVIDTIAERGPLNAKSVSECTGIVLATVYHLLHTLVHEDYLCRLQDGRYALGSQFVSVAQLEGRARDYRLIREAMGQLSAATRAHVLIGILTRGEVEVWSIVEHRGGPRIECWPGARLPGHATSVGKSILSRMSEAQRKQYYRRNPLRAYTSHTITDASRLERQLTGEPLCVSEQELGYGVTCVAAPLQDADLLASVAISYAANRSHRSRAEADVHLVRFAEVISNLLSHSRVPATHIVA
jgi:IclR family transcriptional regulator, acetate operon repressor